MTAKFKEWSLTLKMPELTSVGSHLLLVHCQNTLTVLIKVLTAGTDMFRFLF